MALNYKFTKGQDKRITSDDCYNVCMLMMICGIPVITEKTVVALHKRIALLALFDGVDPVELDLLKLCIGLETNVNRLTATQFLKKFVKDVAVQS